MTSDEFEAILYIMGFEQFTWDNPWELRLRCDARHLEALCDDGRWAVSSVYSGTWGPHLTPDEAYLKLQALL